MKKVFLLILVLVSALALTNCRKPDGGIEKSKGGDDKVRVSGGPKSPADPRKKVAWCVTNKVDPCEKKINLMPRFLLGSIVIQGATYQTANKVTVLDKEYLITFNNDDGMPIAYGLREGKVIEWRNMRINRPIRSIPDFVVTKIVVVGGPVPDNTDDGEVTITLEPNVKYLIDFLQ